MSLLAFAAAGVLSACQRAEPEVSEAEARATALAEVPGCVVESEELEEENGLLIYSYDISLAGRPGVEEIAVDARTGKVVAREHERPADERAEHP